MYFVIKKGAETKLYPMPAGTYRFSELSCGRLKSKFAISELLPAVTVKQKSIAFAGSFSAQAKLVDREDTVYLSVKRELNKKKATKLLRFIAQKSKLPLVSAYTGTTIDDKNWDPKKSTLSHTFLSPLKSSQIVALTSNRWAQSCITSEEKINLLHFGKVQWQVEYKAGKAQRVERLMRQDLFTETFIGCMESSLAETELTEKISGKMRYSLN